MAFSNNSMAEEAKVAEATNGQSTEAKVSEAKATEVDYEVLYEEQRKRTEEAERKASDWKHGYDKYKTIAKEKQGNDTSNEDIDQLSTAELVQREVQRALAGTQATQEKANEKEMFLKMARENKELKKSLANLGQVSSTGQGSSQVEMPVKQNYFSPEKIQTLKNQGWDDAKIERFRQNRLRVNGGKI